MYCCYYNLSLFKRRPISKSLLRLVEVEGNYFSAFWFMRLMINRDWSEDIIHQLSSVFCCETKESDFASGARWFVLRPWNIPTAGNIASKTC
jgi:hypothetical protein